MFHAILKLLPIYFCFFHDTKYKQLIKTAVLIQSLPKINMYYILD